MFKCIHPFASHYPVCQCVHLYGLFMDCLNVFVFVFICLFRGWFISIRFTEFPSSLATPVIHERLVTSLALAADRTSSTGSRPRKWYVQPYGCVFALVIVKVENWKVPPVCHHCYILFFPVFGLRPLVSVCFSSFIYLYGSAG